MDKRIIILAKSNKFSGYCVAGFDIDSQKYIRLVPKNENNNTRASLLEADLQYSNKEPMSVLDIVKCTVTKQEVDKHQTENWVLDVDAPKEKLGTISVTELGKYISYEKLVFCNTEEYVKNDIIDGIVSHSIEVVVVSDVRIYNRYGKVKVDFTYRKNKYTGLSVTDPVYMNAPSQTNSTIKHLDNAVMVVTLPRDTYINGLYYKIVASIFTVENTLDLVKVLEYKLQSLEKYETEYEKTKEELKSFMAKQVDWNTEKEFSSVLYKYKYYPELTYKVFDAEKVQELLGEKMEGCFEEKTRKGFIAMVPLSRKKVQD